MQDNPDSKYNLSSVALDRLARRENYVPQINPEITGTINTKNNSGQLSYDNGTTLICYPVDEKYYLSKQGLNYILNTKFRQDQQIIQKTDVCQSLKATDYKRPKCIDVNQIGFVNQDTQASKVYNTDDISPSLCAGTHRYAMGYIQSDRIAGWFENDNVIGAYQKDEKRSSVSEHIYHKPDGLLNTIQTAHTPKLIDGLCIRRLTPRECFRLQGLDDDFFDRCAAVNSDTQLYKQAGNSITKHTFKALAKRILFAINFNCV